MTKEEATCVCRIIMYAVEHFHNMDDSDYGFEMVLGFVAKFPEHASIIIEMYDKNMPSVAKRYLEKSRDCWWQDFKWEDYFD